VTFREADAEALPFENNSFDIALSTFGVMFTPNQEKSASELVRVIRKGGRIGLANWTPEGFIGQLFKIIGKHLPPPAGVPGTLYIQPIGAWTVSALAKVPLIVPSAWADRAAAQRASEAVAASLASVRLGLRAALAQAAWVGAAAEEIVGASERAVGIARQHRETAARLLAAGETAALAVLKADTEVVKRQSDLVRARAELERARLATAVLLGKAEPVPDQFLYFAQSVGVAFVLTQCRSQEIDR
jgi:hypothetical protein